MTRNIVCEIHFRDSTGVLRNIFTIEGDKAIDSSLYIIQLITINPEGDNSDENIRKFSLQKSLHASVDATGNTRTHFKRAGNTFGVSTHPPAGDRKAVSILFGSSAESLEKYRVGSMQPNDIVIDLNPDHFKYYEYIFTSNDDSLSGILHQEQYISCRTYVLPTKHSVCFKMSVVIRRENLARIQGEIT